MESPWLVVSFQKLIQTGVKWLYRKNECLLLGTLLRLGCSSWACGGWMGQGLDSCLAKALGWWSALWGQPRWLRSLRFCTASHVPWVTTLMRATDSETRQLWDWWLTRFCFVLFLLFFFGQPPPPLLPSKLFPQLAWVSKPVSCLSWTAGMALDWMNRHGARLGWTLGGSQPPGGASWLSNLRCWELGRFNTTADGCLQPGTRTVASAASPGYPDSPAGKAGWHQDPAAP